MSSLNEFIADVKNNGVARLNRFSFNLTTPKILTQLDNDSGIFPISLPFPLDLFRLRRIRLYCESVDVPGFSLATNENRMYGEKREVPYEVMYEPIVATFFCDASLDAKNWFESWVMNIQNPRTRHTRYYDDYTTDASVDVENLKDQIVYTIEFKELYPKFVSPIKMDVNNKDIMRFDVTFAYKYWRGYQKQPVGPLSLDSISVPGGYYRDFRSFQKGLFD